MHIRKKWKRNGGEYEMKIYDISQEVFNCQVYASDPVPEKLSIP